MPPTSRAQPIGRRIVVAAAAATLASGALTRAVRAAASALPATPASTETAVIGRWLAGLSADSADSADSAAAGDAADSVEWAAYAAHETARWNAAAARFATIARWSARALGPLLAPGRSLLYPFSGPDLFHALALFPDARRIFLIGLEPVVALPSPPAPAGFFARLDASLAEFARLLFFRTRAMESDLRQDGVLPILIATLVRAGGRPRTIEIGAAPVTDSRGRECEGALCTPTRARIDWETADGDLRRIDYAQVDLSNGGLAGAGPFVAELRALGPCVTFFKAASYLLGEGRFSYARRLFLEASDTIVQDDSGIPLSYFDAGWVTRPFGAYAPPAAPFEDRFQDDLRAVFASAGAFRPPPLPFAIGYYIDPRASNLLLAVKAR